MTTYATTVAQVEEAKLQLPRIDKLESAIPVVISRRIGQLLLWLIDEQQE